MLVYDTWTIMCIEQQTLNVWSEQRALVDLWASTCSSTWVIMTELWPEGTIAEGQTNIRTDIAIESYSVTRLVSSRRSDSHAASHRHNRYTRRILASCVWPCRIYGVTWTLAEHAEAAQDSYGHVKVSDTYVVVMDVCLGAVHLSANSVTNHFSLGVMWMTVHMNVVHRAWFI